MSVAIQNNFRTLLQAKERQEQRRIKFSEVGKKTGLPVKTVSSWYKNDRIGQIHTGVLEKFCDYFDCAIGDLLVRVPEPN